MEENPPIRSFEDNNTTPELNKLSRRSFLVGMASLITLTISLPASSTVGLYEPFSFAFVTDTHLATQLPDTYKLVHESQLFLQDVVRALNKEKLDFVVFGGDQLEVLGDNESNWQLFLDIAQGLTHPWSFVLGEQDVSDTYPVDKMKTYGADWKRQGIETTKPYWSHSPLPGVHIIGLDTSQPHSPTGYVSNQQLAWLKEDLDAHKRKFIIVFSHHPLLPPPPYDSGPPWDEFILPQCANVREILGSSPKVRLAVSGHIHASRVQQEKDIWYISCPSLNVYPCAYRIFRVTPDQIIIETHQVGFPALIKKARKMLEASTLAYKYAPSQPFKFVSLVQGQRLDNEVLLPLTQAMTPQAITIKKQRRKATRQAEQHEQKPAKQETSKQKTTQQEADKHKQDTHLEAAPGKPPLKEPPLIDW
ncbi:MAG: metallophosphoesterase [Candidatus Melainabacteria bacterium]|nr:metallophosphoesterase [Candidatus Melainabacteria bacterium]